MKYSIFPFCIGENMQSSSKTCFLFVVFLMLMTLKSNDSAQKYITEEKVTLLKNLHATETGLSVLVITHASVILKQPKVHFSNLNNLLQLKLGENKYSGKIIGLHWH